MIRETTEKISDPLITMMKSLFDNGTRLNGTWVYSSTTASIFELSTAEPSDEDEVSTTESYFEKNPWLIACIVVGALLV